jgi:hypothetical protein
MTPAGAAMKAGLAELHRHNDMPPWLQFPQGLGTPDGQQHWPETIPAPAPRQWEQPAGWAATAAKFANGRKSTAQAITANIR